jgi:hypothetical protein
VRLDVWVSRERSVSQVFLQPTLNISASPLPVTSERTSLIPEKIKEKKKEK